MNKQHPIIETKTSGCSWSKRMPHTPQQQNCYHTIDAKMTPSGAATTQKKA